MNKNGIFMGCLEENMLQEWKDLDQAMSPEDWIRFRDDILFWCLGIHAKSLNPSLPKIWIFRIFRKSVWLAIFSKNWNYKIRNWFIHLWNINGIINWIRSFIEFKLIVSNNTTVFQPLSLCNLNICLDNLKKRRPQW